MVINLIIVHDRVHQQIFINNRGKCVQIQIQKLKFAIIVKHFHFFFFSFFLYIFFLSLSLSRLYSSKQCYISRLSFSTIPVYLHFFFSYDSFLILFVFRFVSVTAMCASFFYDIYSTLPNFFNIYIYLQLFFI